MKTVCKIFVINTNTLTLFRKGHFFKSCCETSDGKIIVIYFNILVEVTPQSSVTKNWIRDERLN